MEFMTISQLAKKADVNVETIRYYERRGLLDEPIRNTSGYRQYTSMYLDKIIFIKSAQSIGFTLNEIQDLLTLKISSNAVCNDVKQIAKEKIVLIEEKINDLENIKNTLNELICSCENNELTDDCPILHSIKSK